MIDYLTAFADNYIYILTTTTTTNHFAIVVDPGESKKVKERLIENGLDLWGIFITHHHNDHTGGIKELKEKWPAAKVFAGSKERKKIPRQDVFLNDNDIIETPIGNFRVLDIPGHTLGHVAYYMIENKQSNLFCGDTLFGATCGNLFEGTLEQMFNSLKKIRELPDDTNIWCAHEYTLSGLEFAVKIEPDNLKMRKRLEETKTKYTNKEPTIPLLLELEKETNLYLRWDNVGLQNKFHSKGKDFECFTHLFNLE